MKKLLTLLLAALVLLATLPVYALDLPKLAVTAQPVDYVSAMAGIARPVNKTYAANERYALLVSITVPAYMDTAGMALEVTPKGCTVDNLNTLTLATGDYLIMGTTLAAGATVKVTLRDDAIIQAATAGQLWQAIYNDRTVSATATLGPAAAQPVTGIPKTGDRPEVWGGALCLLLAATLLWRRRYV